MKHPVSRRYARAFLDIGIERGNYLELQSQLREFADAYKTSEPLRLVISNPSIKVAERREVIRKVAAKAGWDQVLTNFALLLLDKDRVEFIEHIAEEFDVLVDQHDGNVRAHVTSAKPLKDSQIASLQGAISRMTGKNVLLETDTDSDLIGGLVTRIGDTVYDGSVRTQLSTLRESILEGTT